MSTPLENYTRTQRKKKINNVFDMQEHTAINFLPSALCITNPRWRPRRACCSHNVQRRNNVPQPKRIRTACWKLAVFLGGGYGVGIQGVQLAKALGMRPIVLDTGASKRALSLQMGADAFVDFKNVSDPADGVEVHGVFITAPAAYRTALSYVGSRVEVGIMGVELAAKGSVTVDGDPNSLIFSSLAIKGTLVGSRRDVAAALGFAK